ncbi:MAG: transposase, partial [Elainellaceae cyanobacterium]
MTHIPRPERSALEQTPHSVLVEMVLQQQQVIEGFTQEVERLKAIVERDSRTSSKPPSSDLLRRSEQPKKEETAAEGESQGDVSP